MAKPILNAFKSLTIQTCVKMIFSNLRRRYAIPLDSAQLRPLPYAAEPLC
ncbi:hypothetical protein DSCO28_00120 [Desulfosarcina ovata subsp. sediminis]|uniref:Uncharacterized protein n=2 Tax=Desulfosarcina ovata TaxID=83564 RepID=A0A5K8A326_9BACT|nr:hypothetical protein DSCO28_00120 [Desulfosarcina ovata subsp. sediminis]BBO86836.1 hypothetical protein DSCOOX_00160 [Desulfosarcina ovata subsp. ovata]